MGGGGGGLGGEGSPHLDMCNGDHTCILTDKQTDNDYKPHADSALCVARIRAIVKMRR